MDIKLDLKLNDPQTTPKLFQKYKNILLNLMAKQENAHLFFWAVDKYMQHFIDLIDIKLESRILGLTSIFYPKTYAEYNDLNRSILLLQLSRNETTKWGHFLHKSEPSTDKK